MRIEAWASEQFWYFELLRGACSLLGHLEERRAAFHFYTSIFFTILDFNIFYTNAFMNLQLVSNGFRLRLSQMHGRDKYCECYRNYILLGMPPIWNKLRNVFSQKHAF